MTRRGHGEGSIYKAADGRWRAVVDLGWQLGKRKRKYLSGKTRREVQEKLNAALRAKQRGLSIDTDERLTVGSFLDRWLEQVSKPAVRTSTYDSYSDLIRLHLKPELGSVRLAALTPQHIQGMLSRKLAAGLSPIRVRYLRAMLRAALVQAVKWDMVPRNVADLVSGPRVPTAEIKPLTPEQARSMLAAVRDDRLEALYVLAIATGLRQGELLGLRWQDVDPERRTLQVSMALHRENGSYLLDEPKTPRSRRAIVLPRLAAEALIRHRKRQAEERALAGPTWRDWPLVFTTDRGAPLNSSSITHRFQSLLERAGLPRQRFHDLRHGTASLLLAQGVQPRAIMGTLGHSNIGMTMDTYSHMSPAMDLDVAERMDAILAAPDSFSPRLAADLAATLDSVDDNEQSK